MSNSLPDGGASLSGFDEKLDSLLSTRNYREILNYLLSLKNQFLSLPTSHKNQALTIQRAVLLVLPLLKTQEAKATKDKASYQWLKHITLKYVDLIEESQYPLPIKVNS